MTCESQTATLQSCARRPGRGVHERARCQRRRRSTAARCHARRVCNDAMKKNVQYFKQMGGSPGRPVQDAQRAGKVADDRETWMEHVNCHHQHEGCKAAAQEEVPVPPAQKPPFLQVGQKRGAPTVQRLARPRRCTPAVHCIDSANPKFQFAKVTQQSVVTFSCF